MEAKALAEKIENWENDYSESFYDYFMHDNIDELQWADFLMKKGYAEKAKEIIEESQYAKGKIWDPEFIYNVYPEYVDNKFIDGNKSKNVLLWGMFLVTKPEYLEKALKFLS